MKQDVMPVLREPDVNLDPLHAVGDRELQGPRGVLRRLVHPTPMSHHLDRARWLDRLEEREGCVAALRRRPGGPEHDSQGEHD